MRDELHVMELVDRYLDGSLTPEERIAFEARLKENGDLRRLMDDQRALREGMQRLPVRAAVMRAERGWSWSRWGPKLGGALVMVGLIATGVLYLRSEHGSVLQEIITVTHVDTIRVEVPAPARPDSVVVDTIVRTRTIIRVDTLRQLIMDTKVVPVMKEAQRAEAAAVVSEVKPSYPGGFEAMYAYLKQNMHYPSEDPHEGTVVIRFVVDEQGRILDATVAQSLDPECDAEALRVIKAMPRWIPAMSNGKPVKSSVEVPLQFGSEEVGK